MELSYSKRGDYLLPDLFLAEQSCIGKYGMLRKTFLKRHRPATYTAFLLSGELLKHLADTDRLAHEHVQLPIKKKAEAQRHYLIAESSRLNGMDSPDEQHPLMRRGSSTDRGDIRMRDERRYLRLAEERCTDAVNVLLVKVVD